MREVHEYPLSLKRKEEAKKSQGEVYDHCS